jgi:amino-acid N-acetyltransferase
MIPGDYPTALRLINAAAARGELLPRSETYLRRHETEFVVAVANGHVGGVASFHPYSYRLGEVLALSVSPAFRKKGYDTLLIKACQTKATLYGVRLVMIITSPAEASFLKKLGFGPATRTERFGLFWSSAEATPLYDHNLIRPAQPRDYPALHRLIRAAAEQGKLLPRPLEEITFHGEEFFVALGGGADGPVIGGAALEIYQPDLPQQTPELAEIRSLVVDPEWVNQHYGKHLVRAGQQRAREKGVREVLVVTSQVKFFRELGFKRATRADCLAFFWHPQ